jgi:hypothetical protein
MYLKAYLLFLVLAALISLQWPKESWSAVAGAFLFLITLGILIYLKVSRPDDLWYNGRAVAESVKTRSWRWMMRSEPYHSEKDPHQVQNEFINNLRDILKENESLSKEMDSGSSANSPISDRMKEIRSKSLQERLEIYKLYRIEEQRTWYSDKAKHNKNQATKWFWFSVVLHIIAILLLLYKIMNSSSDFPISVFATAASAALTWLQARKYSELQSSYTLTAHEIAHIRDQVVVLSNEDDLSDFVINTENAFSREHTQWIAKKNN